MNKLIRIEEAAMFAGSLLAFMLLDMSWWWYAGFILVPDIGMLGYVHNARTGAFTYNLFHHKAVAVAMGAAGYIFNNHWLIFTGLILFSHSSMDRMLGYGLKYEKGFRFTHLGEIGTTAV